MMAMSVVVGSVALGGVAQATTHKPITVDDDGGADYTTIQAAIDNASEGDTIKVKPGTYEETAEDRLVRGAKHDFGLYINKSGLTIVGVNENGERIDDTDDIAAEVQAVPENPPGWGPVSYWIGPGADNVTIQGLEFTDTSQVTGNSGNKNFEIEGDNLTIRHSIVGATTGVPSSLYFNSDSVQSFTITDNKIDGLISVNNGAGDTAPRSERVIKNNDIGALVMITGDEEGVPWRNNPSGAVTLTNNTIKGFSGYLVLTTGEVYEQPWEEYFTENAFPEGSAIALENPEAFDPSTFSFGVDNQSKAITSSLGLSVETIANNGDMVKVGPGTYDSVDIDKPLTLTSTGTPEETIIKSTDEAAIDIPAGTPNIEGSVAIEGFTLKAAHGGSNPHGVYIADDGTNATEVNSITLRNNILIPNGTGFGSGAFLHEVKKSITLTNNEIRGGYDGINIAGDGTPSVTVKNNIINNTNDNGIEVNNVDDLVFKNNKLKNWGNNDVDAAGLEIAEDGNVTGDVTATGNTIKEGRNGIGIYPNANSSGPPGTISINRNNLETEVVGLRVAKGVGETIDATNNWWGHASGPGGPDGRVNPAGKEVGQGSDIVVKGEGEVLFDPWLRRPIDNPSR